LNIAISPREHFSGAPTFLEPTTFAVEQSPHIWRRGIYEPYKSLYFKSSPL
jgi:hypothetical protein